MEDGSGKEVKHILLGKFKDEVTEDEIEELINRYGQLVSIIPPMKDFKWGTKVSIRDLDQGFTHVFESTFDSIHGVAVFLDHPAHVQFKNQFVPRLDKLLVIDCVLHP